LISDRIFTIFDEDGWEGKFSIMDFYIKECAKRIIHGILPESLKRMDVGKVETLKDAGTFISTIK
jgi:hypothetical protein